MIVATSAVAAPTAAQWTKGMDDDAGKAAATSRADLPAADLSGMRHIYPKGSFTIYAAEMGAPPPDVVPDLTYTHHYAF